MVISQAAPTLASLPAPVSSIQKSTTLSSADTPSFFKNTHKVCVQRYLRVSVGICWCLLASDAALRGINERFKVFWIVGGADGCM